MPCPADTQDLDVYSPCLLDGLFVGITVSLYLRNGTLPVQQVYVGRGYVHVPKEMLVHEVPVTLRFRPTDRVVFIQVEGENVGEGKSLLPVETNQFLVDPQGRRPRRKPQHAGFTFLAAASDQAGNFPRYLLTSFLRVLADSGRNPLQIGEVAGYHTKNSIVEIFFLDKSVSRYINSIK